ncbi:unnamed protein product [Mytilus coruscus]|uniref:Protein kinase domain-containing protein n=1 Tax=Mytilus coruscus TaxID=42192 RepID=A0A6J8DEP6_MYTCO|nr:unnamed protein product [Mytilus coruscus]
MSSRENVKPWDLKAIQLILNEICDDKDYFPKDITDSEESSLWFVFVSSKQKISKFRKILKKETNVVFVDSEQLDLIEDDKSKTWDNTTFYVGMHVPPEEHDGPFCAGTRNIESQIKSGCETKDSLDDNAEEMDMIWMKEGMSDRGASTCETLQVPFVKMHINGSLGKGASGECKRVTDEYSREAARKIIVKKDGPKALRQLESMVKLMGNGLPQIFTIKERDHYYEIFMELIFPCISMTVLTKRLVDVMSSIADRGRRFLHYLFYQLLGEISKFHEQKISHGDLGVSNNESNILLQKTEKHVLVVRLIDPSDINDMIEIDLNDISFHIRTIGEICNDIKDTIFDKFRNGKIISTKQEAEDLRQQFSDLGEMFAKDPTYRKQISDVLFDESKIEEVQSLGNITEMQDGNSKKVDYEDDD